MRQLRPYQLEAISKIKGDLLANRKSLFVAATGLGKTFITVSLCDDLAKNKDRYGIKRFFFICSRNRVLDQARDDFEGLGFYCVRVEAGKPNIGALFCDVVLVSSQMFIRHVSRYGISHNDLLILDETHNLVSESNRFREVIDTIQKDVNPYFLGLTATPFKKVKGLIYGGPRDFFKKPSSRFDILWAIENSYLVPIKFSQGREEFDTSQTKMSAGDFHQGELSKLVLSDDHKVELQVQDFLARSKDRNCIAVACTTIEHAELVARKIKEEGESCSIVYSSQDKKTNSNNVDAFHSGQSRIMVFVIMLSEGYDCLDRETEIMTEHGWSGYSPDLAEKKIYSVNPETLEVELVDCQRAFKRLPRKGEQVVSLKSQHLDCRVTDNHNFFYALKTGGKRILGKFSLARWGRIPCDRFTMLQGGLCGDKQKAGFSDSQAWLLGMFMADGCEGTDGRRTISQSKPLIVEKIRKMLLASGLDWSERSRPVRGSWKTNYNTVYIFGIPKGTHHGSMARNGWSQIFGNCLSKKTIDRRMYKLSRQEFLCLWEGFLDGNGSIPKNKTKAPHAVTGSKIIYDYIMHSAVRLGFCATGTVRKSSFNREYYIIRVKERTQIDLALKDKRGAKAVLSPPLDDDFFWCVTNKNQTIITRRKGKVLVIGNCPPIDCIVLMRPTRSKTLYAQIAGRGLRLSEGKKDCLLLDYGQVVPNLGFPGIIDDEKSYSQGTTDQAQAPMKLCPKCLSYVFMALGECSECGHQFPKVDRDNLKNLTTTAGQVKPGEVEFLCTGIQEETFVSGNGNLCKKITYNCNELSFSEFFPMTFIFGKKNYRLKRKLISDCIGGFSNLENFFFENNLKLKTRKKKSNYWEVTAIERVRTSKQDTASTISEVDLPF